MSCTQWIMGEKQKNLMEENVLQCCYAANEDQQKTYGHFQILEKPLGTHLKGGLTFYEHLVLLLQDQHELRLQSYTDWPHSEIHVIRCQKVGPTSEEVVAWARMACHCFLLYLGDSFRYQNEV